MNETRKIILYLVFLCLAYSAYGDIRDLSFDLVETKYGQKPGAVQSFLEDSHGLLWIAAQGALFRYDGEDLDLYTNKTYDPNSFSKGQAFGISEDSKGRIWVGTDRELAVYNAYEDSFSHFSNYGERIYTSMEDPGNTIWVNTESGIYTLDEKTGNFNPIRLHNEKVEGSFFYTSPLHISHDGRFWAGTPDGLFRIDWQNKTVQPVSMINSSESESAQKIVQIGEDSSGNLWIATSSDGLYFLNKGGDRAESVKFNSYSSEAEINTSIMNLHAGLSGSLWITCQSEGLYEYRISSEEIYLYPVRSDEPHSLPGVLADCAYEDSSGVLWISNNVSVFRADLRESPFTSAMEGNVVVDIFEVEKEKFLVTTQNGTFQFDRSLNEARLLSSILGIELDEPGIALEVLKDAQGRIWLGYAGGGLKMIDGNTKEIRHFNSGKKDRDFLPSDIVYEIYEDSSGVIWFGTSTSGLCYFDEKSDEVKIVVTDEDSAFLNETEVWRILERENGTFWIATKAGLVHYDPSSGAVETIKNIPGDENSLIDDHIICLDSAPNGNLWIGSWYSGIDEYNPDENSFRHYNDQYGLPDDDIMSILVAGNDDIWAGTFLGLVHLSGPERNLRIYFTKDGLPHNAFMGTSSALKASDGSFFFGTENGLFWFYPEEVKLSNEPVRTVLREVRGAKGEWSLKNAYLHRELVIDWNDPSMIVDFRAVDKRPDSEILYSYRLAGLNDQWSNSGFVNQAQYSNLPPGKYEFQVRGTGSAGVWSPEENWGKISVVVKAHPLRSLPAISVYFLLFISALTLSFLSYRKNQQKKLAQERQISDRLRKVDSLKDQFLANTTHELRTPLNGIIGLTESLIEKSGSNVSEGMKKDLSLIASSGRRLGFLINDILDLSRLKEGDITLNSGPVDLAKLTNTVMVLSRPLLSGKSVALENRIPDDLPMAKGDINRIQQILHNLIGNSVKFTTNGEISVTAQLNESQIEVAVSDTGIGIHPDKQDAVWESFQQVDGSESREYSGTGLGLPITKQLVVLHGGEIRLESVPGEGTSFIFTLPVSDETVAVKRNEAIASVFDEGPDMEERKMDFLMEGQADILLVDDEAVNRHVVQSQLDGTRYSLKSVSSGEEALKSLEEELPDLILLDIMMPQMDGYEVCRIIREKYSPGELPVIMVSAKNQVADLVKGLASGANDFISKPYSGRELIARMETHLEVSAAHSSFGKFVPRDLMKLMDNNPDQKINRNMTVLLSSFSIDRETDDVEIFSFVSSFLPEVLPVIRESGGIIYRYEGEGILSFFPGSPDEALCASLKIEKLVAAYNRKKGKKDALRVDSSLLEESVLIGLAGDDDFTGEIVASKVIDQTVALNKVGRLLGSSITTDEPTLTKLESGDKRRLLAYVPDESPRGYKPVYEIIASSSPGGHHKLDSSTLYGEALKSFHEGRFDEASARFGSVLEMNPKDRAAEKYRERCLFYMNNPPQGEDVSIL